MDYTSPVWPRSALVVIDLQGDFLDGGASPIPGTSGIVKTVAELAAAFRQVGRPIVHVIRLYEPGGSDVDLPRREVIEAGARVVAPNSDGSQIPDVVLPQTTALDTEVLLAGDTQRLGEREVVMFKPRWSAFYRTDLETWLHDQQCDTVVVAGCNLPNCPRATLFDASQRDFRTVLAYDAVSQATHERLTDLTRIGVTLMSASEVAKALQTTRPTT